MKKIVMSSALGFALAGTASAGAGFPALIAAIEQAKDPTYGYTQENPVHVGQHDARGGPADERAFLDRLRGPAGQKVSYRRLGSCCGFPTPNGVFGLGLLDQYEITYDGLEKPLSLYIDFYTAGTVTAPVGLQLEPEQ